MSDLPQRLRALGREVAEAWRRRSDRTRRWVGGSLVVLACLLVGALAGTTTAGADGALGPHRARYEMTVDRTVTVDLGPLGALVMDSPLPWPLGLDVTVREVPADLARVSANPNLALADDLDGYLQFFAQPEVAVGQAVSDLVGDVLRRTVLVAGLLLITAAAVRLASPRDVHRVLRAALRRPGVAALVGAVVVTVVLVPLAGADRRHETEGRTLDVLAGTPLEGARIVGRIGDFVEAYGAYAIDAVADNREFYDRVTTNLVAAYAADPEPLAPAPPPEPEVDETPGATPGASPEAEATPEEPTPEAPEVPDGATPDGEAVDGEAVDGEAVDGEAVDQPDATEPTPTAPPTGGPEDIVTFLVVADLHCNVGMAEVVGEAVRQSGARALLNLGDTVIAGTSVEQFCVDALARAVPTGIPVVVADGNHDSELTGAQQRSAGHLVLEGAPVVVEGVRFLGDAEPTLTTVAEGTRLKGTETRGQMGRRLARTACELQEEGSPVDVLMVHNPRAGVAAMTTGCVPLQLSGHMHRQIGPTPQGLGILFGAASSGGASLGGQTIGPLQAPAWLAVLRFDPVGHRPVDFRVITVGTDTEVELGPWETFPDPADEPVEAELGAPEPEN